MNSVSILNNILRSAISPCLTAPSTILLQQTRNTVILKRRTPPNLFKKNSGYPRLRRRNRIYDLVEDTATRPQPPINIILTEFVEGVGNRGDVISKSPMKAYNYFLLPGLAVYPTPENLRKYNVENKSETTVDQRSIFLNRTLDILSQSLLNVVMSADNPWTLEKWHLRSSFRKMGIYLDDSCITMPQRPISGPNLQIENKEFYVTVTVNKTSEVIVRCRIHHWSNNPNNSVPYVPKFYLNPSEPIYPEDKSVLDSLPLPYRMKQEIDKLENISQTE